ncbi:hypothetical protein AWENTII_005633 [Aspergillus wentii]
MKKKSEEKMGTGCFDVHRTGFRGALEACKNVLPALLAVWNGPEYMAIYHNCVDIISQLQPAIIVVGPLFYQAIDACRVLKAKYVVLCPNTFKEHVPQPRLANVWKFSAMCSGYSYPLPWRLVLPNAYLILKLVYSVHTATEYKGLRKYRNAHGIPGPNPSMAIMAGDKTPHLLPGSVDAEFPCVLPAHFTLCGPILRPCLPISEENPDLAVWLSQRPTFLINLGSHVTFNSTVQRQFADALQLLFNQRRDIQVLWKMKLANDTRPDIKALKGISDFISNGRVRIETWLSVDPIGVLQSDRVAWVVHHGVVNSYYEAIRAGVTQIVLPIWFDTFDFAARVEWLGIGTWANRKNGPGVDGQELGQSLIRAIASDESSKMRQKAEAITNGESERRPGGGMREDH